MLTSLLVIFPSQMPFVHCEAPLADSQKPSKLCHEYKSASLIQRLYQHVELKYHKKVESNLDQDWKQSKTVKLDSSVHIGEESLLIPLHEHPSRPAAGWNASPTGKKDQQLTTGPSRACKNLTSGSASIPVASHWELVLHFASKEVYRKFSRGLIQRHVSYVCKLSLTRALEDKTAGPSC